MTSSLNRKLTKYERILYFFDNYYETGMEFAITLENMINEDLDNYEWYGEKIHIPKYSNEILKKILDHPFYISNNFHEPINVLYRNRIVIYASEDDYRKIMNKFHNDAGKYSNCVDVLQRYVIIKVDKQTIRESNLNTISNE